MRIFLLLVICIVTHVRCEGPQDAIEGVVEVTEDSFAEEIKHGKGHTLILFYTPRCPWSRKFAQELRTLAALLRSHAQIVSLAKMDVSNVVASDFKIRNKIYGTPTLIFFKRGDFTPIHLPGPPLWRDYWRTTSDDRLERILRFVNENSKLAILLSDLAAPSRASVRPSFEAAVAESLGGQALVDADEDYGPQLPAGGVPVAPPKKRKPRAPTATEPEISRNLHPLFEPKVQKSEPVTGDTGEIVGLDPAAVDTPSSTKTPDIPQDNQHKREADPDTQNQHSEFAELPPVAPEPEPTNRNQQNQQPENTGHAEGKAAATNIADESQSDNNSNEVSIETSTPPPVPEDTGVEHVTISPPESTDSTSAEQPTDAGTSGGESSDLGETTTKPLDPEPRTMEPEDPTTLRRKERHSRLLSQKRNRPTFRGDELEIGFGEASAGQQNPRANRGSSPGSNTLPRANRPLFPGDAPGSQKNSNEDQLN